MHLTFYLNIQKTCLYLQVQLHFMCNTLHFTITLIDLIQNPH